uniref:Ribonuclease A-domain domain-containing protein n=1 Tax=Podarcis muralis TaxID=64176 RepID=A0A670JNP7_PODMU
MAQTTACWLLLFLMVLPALTQRESRSEKFRRQHIDFPKTRSDMDARRYCNLMMQRRGMTDGVCKPSNTFIHGDPMADICGRGGTHYRRALRLSRAQLSVTTCKLQGTSRGQCRYWAHTGQRHILIGCDASGWPVHFEESNFM